MFLVPGCACWCSMKLQAEGCGSIYLMNADSDICDQVMSCMPGEVMFYETGTCKQSNSEVMNFGNTLQMIFKWLAEKHHMIDNGIYIASEVQ